MLTDASIEGKVDTLLGLKENVIIGKLIPAATGLKKYRTIEMGPSERVPVSARPETEAELLAALEELPAARLSGEGEIRPREVVAEGEERLVGEASGGVRQAVAEVQGRSVSALPEAPVRVHRDRPVFLAERDNLCGQLAEEARQQRAGAYAELGGQHDTRLGQRGRSDSGRVCVRESGKGRLVTVLAEQDGDDDRAVEDHAPSLP